MYVELESKGLYDGNTRSMKLNGVEYSTATKGIQIIVFNHDKNFEETRNFQTNLSDSETDAMVSFLDSISDWKTVLIAVLEDGATYLHPEAYIAL